MSIWRFHVEDGTTTSGGCDGREELRRGCNKPYRGRYWCTKRGWFRNELCPFANLRECDNFEAMCGDV